MELGMELEMNLELGRAGEHPVDQRERERDNEAPTIDVALDIVFSPTRPRHIEGIVKKLMDTPFGLPLFDALYAGPDLERSHPLPFTLQDSMDDPGLDPRFVIDISRIEQVSTYNSFNLRQYGQPPPPPDLITKRSEKFLYIDPFTASALFTKSSMFNHSCRPNAIYRLYGDVLVVRAGRDIDRGAEISISYVQDEERSFEHRARSLKRHLDSGGCGCNACAADLTDGGAGSRLRAKLMAEAEGSMFSTTEGSLSEKVTGAFLKDQSTGELADELEELVSEFTDLVQALEATYPPSLRFRPSLLGPLRTVSDIFALQTNSDESSFLLLAIDAAILALANIGFSFYDRSPTTMDDVSSPLLVDFARSELVYAATEAPHLFYSILLSLSRLRLPKRRASWMRAFGKLEEVLSGGGGEFFRFRHEKQTDSQKYTYRFGEYSVEMRV